MTIRRIVAALGDAPAAEVVAAFAVRLAGQRGAVTFAHAIDRAAAAKRLAPGDPTSLFDRLEDEERHLFERAEELARGAGAAADTASLDGRPLDELIALVEREQPDAVVVGTHAHGGVERLLLESTAVRLLAVVSVPVVAVPVDGAVPVAPDLPLRRVAVGFDASDAAGLAAECAVAVAAAHRAQVVFCTLADPDRDPDVRIALGRAVARANEAEVASDVVRVFGRPADAILSAASALHADLTAVGARGRPSLAGVLFRSGAEALVLADWLPVLAVRARPPEAEPAENAELG